MKKDNKIINIKINFYKTILEELNFSLSSDKINILIGKNGVGKSNILKAIASNNKLEDGWEPKITINREKYNSRELRIEIKSMYTHWVTYSIKRNVSKTRFISPDYIIKKAREKGFKKVPIFSDKNIPYSLSSPELNIDWVVREDEIEMKRDFIESLKKETTVFKTEYIENSELLANFQYKYDFSSDFFDAEENGESKDRNLLMIINLFESLNPDIDITNVLKDYLKQLDDSDDSDDNEEEIDNRTAEINKIFETSLSGLFEKYFKDVFDFKLSIIINKRKLSFEISHNKNYIFESKKIKESSSGIKSILYLIIRIESLIYINKKNVDSRLIILLDEPEKNLFPELQNRLIKYLGYLLKNNDNVYIMLTTHHMSMIPMVDFSLNIISRDDEGRTVNDIEYGACSYIDAKCDNISKNTTVYPIIKSIIDSNKKWEDFFKI